jgi:murein DD-endopeptidase MepM/ murein hydrolase activator NlpD
LVVLPLFGCVTITPQISFDFYEAYPGGKHYHKGIDIDQPRGTPIIAAADGTVAATQTSYIYLVSKRVVIDHGEGLETEYQHMDTVTVKPGQRVKRGEVIGTVGTTGRMGPGVDREPPKPHLHLEVLKYGSRQDPKKYIVGCLDPKRDYQQSEMIWPTGCP